MQDNSLCRSIFKNGDSAPEETTYTQIWIELINQIERAKAVLAGA